MRAVPFVLESVNEVKVQLAASPAGTGTDPVILPVKINLADPDGDGWADLLSAISDGGKYVALDLSESTMIGTEFDPRPRAPGAGESLVVSLVLPDAAAGIKAGDPGDVAFKRFSALKEVHAASVTDISGAAFANCGALTTVSFPEAASIGNFAFANCGLIAAAFPGATGIGDGAFYACGALIAVSFPRATGVGDGAFYACGALTTVSFPEVTNIGGDAFAFCAALTTAAFPRVTGIGNFAFEGCAALTTASFPEAVNIGHIVFSGIGSTALTVTLPRDAPAVSNTGYSNDSYSKTVTVRTPSNPRGYDEAWQDDFRKVFGENAVITLKFVTYAT
jgi:hypothetical protein